MRVSLVDPSAFTPPYDRALAAALARAGAEVELHTSRFLYGPVPGAEGFEVDERFYRGAARAGAGSKMRLPLKALEHPARMFGAARRLPAGADIVHWQWLTVPILDRYLLRPSPVPRLITLHYPLPPPEEPRALARQRSILDRFDAVVSHTRHGAHRLAADVGLDPERIHVIPHGAMDYLDEIADPEPLAPELEEVRGPVVLFFGLLRPYKGIDTLIEAFSRLSVPGAELWIAGMPRMPIEPLRALADRAPGRVRFMPRFISDAEIPALMRRADLLVLPYREIEQSGVLYTGLAFGKPMILSDVGGFSELGRDHRAARLVAPDDPAALATALGDLLTDELGREQLAAAAAAAAAGAFSWEAIAAQTLDLYERLVAAAR